MGYIRGNLGRTHVDEEDKKQIAYYDLQKLGLNDFGTKGGVLIKNSDVLNKDIRKLNNAGEKFLTESGVYKLIFKSKKKEAKKFKRWVTSEVI